MCCCCWFFSPVLKWLSLYLATLWNEVEKYAGQFSPIHKICFCFRRFSVCEMFSSLFPFINWNWAIDRKQNIQLWEFQEIISFLKHLDSSDCFCYCWVFTVQYGFWFKWDLYGGTGVLWLFIGKSVLAADESYMIDIISPNLSFFRQHFTQTLFRARKLNDILFGCTAFNFTILKAISCSNFHFIHEMMI